MPFVPEILCTCCMNLLWPCLGASRLFEGDSSSMENNGEWRCSAAVPHCVIINITVIADVQHISQSSILCQRWSSAGFIWEDGDCDNVKLFPISKNEAIISCSCNSAGVYKAWCPCLTLSLLCTKQAAYLCKQYLAVAQFATTSF